MAALRAHRHTGAAARSIRSRRQLNELAEWVDSGWLRVPIAATYPLRSEREACESGRRPGRRGVKAVIVFRA